jgi:hypothetical protein
MLRGLRYTRAALLTFGFGLLFGLAVVAGDIPSLQRVAAAFIALGLALLPVGLIADGRLLILRRLFAPARRGRRASRSRSRSTAARRPAPVRNPGGAPRRKRR